MRVHRAFSRLEDESIQEFVPINGDDSYKDAPKVLLAEDSLLDREIVRRMFCVLGYDNIDVVQNGLEALQAAERTAYDLVVMDIQMPKMDGIEAAKSIRRLRGRMPKIIFITSSAPSFYRDLCFEAGGNDFLTKPLMLDELRTAIDRIINPESNST